MKYISPIIYSLLVPVIFFSSFVSIRAQCTIELKEVVFYTPSNSGGVPNNKKWVRISSDDNFVPGGSPAPISGIDKTTAWKNVSGAIEIKPIAIVSGSLPRISAIFTCPNTQACTDHPWVRGRWALDPSGVVLLKPKLLTSSYEYTLENVNVNFLNEVKVDECRYLKDFEIIWEYSISETGPWISQAGVSKIPLYCTFREPVASAGWYYGPVRSYTSLHIGCKYGNGSSSASSLASNIYVNAFGDQCVARPTDSDTDCMHYWGSLSEPTSSTYDQNFKNWRSLWYMLSKKDARCGEWSEFLGDILSIQGISDNGVGLSCTQVGIYPFNANSTFTGATNIAILIGTVKSYFGTMFDEINPYDFTMEVWIESEYGMPYGQFFVKTWNFSQGENIIYSSESSSTSVASPNNPQLFIFGADITGLGAQGNTNPRSQFADHQVLKYDGQYFDPSYGSTIFGTKGQWVLNSLDGVGVLVNRRLPSGAIKPYYWLYQKINSANTSSIYFTE